MFNNQSSTASPVLAGAPRPGFYEHFDRAGRRYCEQAETKKTAEFSYPRIAHAATPCNTDGKPDLITSSRAIYRLQHEIKSEGKLKFANDYYRRRVSTQPN